MPDLEGFTTAVLAAVLVLAGCTRKPAHGGKSVSPAGATGLVLPHLVAAVDPGTAGAQGVSIELDDRTGQPRGTVVLRLDYFPEAKAGSRVLPVCYPSLPPDFDLGWIVCDGGPGGKMPLHVKNVRQACYTDARVAEIPAAAPTLLVGCKKALAYVHKFAPELQLDVEAQDVN